MIVVSANTRQFTVLAADQIFGVEFDSGAEVKQFQCPRYVGNNIDLAGSFLRINYRNANGETDTYLVEDAIVEGDNIRFSWMLSPKVTAYKGDVKYVLCATGPDLKLAWHTTLGAGKVLEGLEPDHSHVEEETNDVVAQLIGLMNNQAEIVKATGAAQVAVVEAATAAQVAEIEAKGKNVRDSIPEDYTALSDAVALKAPAIVCEAEGSVITLDDSSDMRFQGMRIFGRSVQNGVPSPAAPVEIVSIEDPTVSADEQTLSVSRTLRGIPVASGGNYTDATGQQWICDEVDLERGVYVQRLHHHAFTGAEVFASFDEGAITGETFPKLGLPDCKVATPDMSTNKSNLLCNVGLVRTQYDLKHGVADGVAVSQWGNPSFLYFRTATYGDAASLAATMRSAYEAEKPYEIIYELKTPIETPLSETEIAAYRALHTNKPNTTILNDAGAHMAVEYVADTKRYIDNKIAALMGG